MAKTFELRRDETLDGSFRRIASAQLTRAANALTDAKLSPEKRVHEARKRFKESRALIRLFRRCLRGEFAALNRWYRDSARLIAPYRDATAIVEAIAELPDDLRDTIGSGAIHSLSRHVRERRDGLYADRTAYDAAIESVLSGFAAMRLRVETLKLDCDDNQLRDELARIVHSGAQGMRKALATGGEVEFHEWRKRVKDQWYHVQLFTPAWPELFAAREKVLDELSHILGAHHDLAVVRETAASQLGADDAASIGNVLRARQEQLAEKALPIAERIFATPARDRARETMSLWRAWRRA